MTGEAAERPGRFAQLRHKPLWILGGFVTAAVSAMCSIASISLSPPSITLKPLAFSTATTQLLVNQPSTITNGKFIPNFWRFYVRAEALASVMTSPELKTAMARASSIPASEIAVDGPIATNLQRTQQEPTGPKRANQIIVQDALYRVTVDMDPVGPVIGVTAQAPTQSKAAALANAAGTALAAYVSAIQRAAHAPSGGRYEVSSVGPATATPPSKRGPIEIACLVFLIVFVLWWGFALACSKFVREIRELGSAQSKVRGDADRSSNGRAPRDEAAARPLPATGP